MLYVRTKEDPRCWVSIDGTIIGVRGKPLKPAPVTGGYLTVNLGGKTRKVAHVVAQAFLGPRPDGCQVAHLNGQNTDNRLVNLAYATKAENESHKIDHGTSAHGERNGRAKLSNDDVENIKRHLELGFKQTTVAELFGITQGHVSAIKRGASW